MNPRLSSASVVCPIPSGFRLEGTVDVPPSKSFTQRWLNAVLLADEEFQIHRPLRSDDTLRFLRALRQLGYVIEETPERWELTPGIWPSAAAIDCGDNGTMLRLLLGSLSSRPGTWVLDGSERLRQRPVGPLVKALRELGARIDCPERDGFAPIRIDGGPLRGGELELDTRLSSQFASSLMMAAVRAESPVELRIQTVGSAPYLDLTLATLQSTGADVECLGKGSYRISPGLLHGGAYTVEGDWSAAAYPAAGALLTGGRVRLCGLLRESLQGDRRVLEILASMGARLEWVGSDLVVERERDLTAVDVDCSDIPDQVPTLAVLGPFAAGSTGIRNVPQLRLKESDRLAAMARELNRLGASVDEYPDALVIHGFWATDTPPCREVEVQTYRDHRIAMSLALCGLRRPGTIVRDPEVVAKSYPAFWRDLESLLSR